MDVHITDEVGLAVLRDASVHVPSLEATSRTPLEAMARAGEVFFIDGEDPIDLNVRVCVDESVAEELGALYDATGGTFLLHVPTGDLVISGFRSWSDGEPPTHRVQVPPADYGVQAYRLRTTDLGELTARQEALVGPDNWAFRSRVDRLMLLGCLPTVAVAVCLAVPPLRASTPWVIGLAVAAWLPHVVFRSSRRYTRIAQQIRAYERSLPLFMLELRPLESTAGLVGGSVMTC